MARSIQNSEGRLILQFWVMCGEQLRRFHPGIVLQKLPHGLWEAISQPSARLLLASSAGHSSLAGTAACPAGTSSAWACTWLSHNNSLGGAVGSNGLYPSPCGALGEGNPFLFSGLCEDAASLWRTRANSPKKKMKIYLKTKRTNKKNCKIPKKYWKNNNKKE